MLIRPDNWAPIDVLFVLFVTSARSDFSEVLVFYCYRFFSTNFSKQFSPHTKTRLENSQSKRAHIYMYIHTRNIRACCYACANFKMCACVALCPPQWRNATKTRRALENRRRGDPKTVLVRKRTRTRVGRTTRFFVLFICCESNFVDRARFKRKNGHGDRSTQNVLNVAFCSKRTLRGEIISAIRQ